MEFDFTGLFGESEKKTPCETACGGVLASGQGSLPFCVIASQRASGEAQASIMQNGAAILETLLDLYEAETSQDMKAFFTRHIEAMTRLVNDMEQLSKARAE